MMPHVPHVVGASGSAAERVRSVVVVDVARSVDIPRIVGIATIS